MVFPEGTPYTTVLDGTIEFSFGGSTKRLYHSGKTGPIAEVSNIVNIVSLYYFSTP